MILGHTEMCVYSHTAVSIGNSLEEVSEDMKRESVLTSWQSRLMGGLFLRSTVLC